MIILFNSVDYFVKKLRNSMSLRKIQKDKNFVPGSEIANVEEKLNIINGTVTRTVDIVQFLLNLKTGKKIIYQIIKIVTTIFIAVYFFLTPLLPRSPNSNNTLKPIVLTELVQDKNMGQNSDYMGDILGQNKFRDGS